MAFLFFFLGPWQLAVRLRTVFRSGIHMWESPEHSGSPKQDNTVDFLIINSTVKWKGLANPQAKWNMYYPAWYTNTLFKKITYGIAWFNRWLVLSIQYTNRNTDFMIDSFSIFLILNNNYVLWKFSVPCILNINKF